MEKWVGNCDQCGKKTVFTNTGRTRYNLCGNCETLWKKNPYRIDVPTVDIDTIDLKTTTPKPDQSQNVPIKV